MTLRSMLAMWPSMLIGALVGMVGAVAIVASTDAVQDWYRSIYPPATLEWHTIQRLDADTLRMTLLVTRHDDCQMVRAMAYTGESLLLMQPATSFERQDGKPPQSYPVGITVISRPWLLRGIFGSKLAVTAYYDCAGSVLKAPILIGDVPEMKP